MGSVPGSLFGHQPKTTVQQICIDQNSGQIRKLGEDQPIAIRRRLNSALESVGGKIMRSAAFRRRTLSSNNRRGSTSFQQKVQQTEQLNALKMRFSEGESEKQNKIGQINNNEHIKTSLENKNLIKIKKTSREEENVNIFNKLIVENHSEDKLNFNSSICSEQTTTTTSFGRHKEEEFNNISSYNLNSKEEKNNCGDDINDDVEILIDIKNEENEIINSALADTFYIEKRELNLENQHQQQSQQHPHNPQQQSQTSSPPSLSPLRTRLWTAPLETSNKRIQQKQPCKAVFRSAQRRSATGIRRADKHLEEPALLVDLEGICLDEKCLNNLIDKNENLENSKEERKTPENTSSNLPSSSLTTARRLSNTSSENTKREKKNSAMSKDSGIDF